MTSLNINSRLNLDLPIVDQVIQTLVPELRLRETEAAVWLNGQPAAAIVAASLLEGIGTSNGFRLPTIVIHGGGADVSVEKGVFDLNNWRHNIVRPKRETLAIEEVPQKRIVVLDSMGFGLASEMRMRLATAVGGTQEGIEVFNIKLGQADYDHPEAGVIEKIMELPSYVWAQNTQVILLPEGWAPRAVIMAVACYALRHTWPDVLRVLSLGPGKGVDYKELIGIQELRQRGAHLVTQWEENKTLEAIVTATHAIGDILRNEGGNILYMKLPDNRELKLVVTAAEIV